MFLTKRKSIPVVATGGVEKPKDRDFIETIEGLLFCVVGYLHPPDQYTAYLKYIPSPHGKWGRSGTCYARALPYYHVSQVENTYDFLRKNYPQYIFDCPVRNITVSSVPHSRVKTYYRPRDRLRSVESFGADDDLERRLIDLITFLSEISGVRHDDFGVTGSLLTATHNPGFSDIDLTVYGSSASLRLKSALTRKRGKHDEIRSLDHEEMLEWSRSRSQRFPMKLEELMVLADRRWNYGIHGGTYFSVHPIRTDEEIAERYGERLYRQQGEVSGTARIVDNRESIYLPAIYAVEDVESRSEEATSITSIVSYEGLFCDAFEKGELVAFEGNLEEVSGSQESHQAVIGGSGHSGGYMKLANE
jgi:hypothetical protein